MGIVEEDHALKLILSQLSKLKNGDKLKIGMDIDDTVADTSAVVKSLLEERHGFDFKPVGKRFNWSAAGVTDKHFIEVYNELWLADGRQIKPLLSRGSFKVLNQKADLTFVSARDPKTAEGLRRWLDRQYGAATRLTIVDQVPYDMHGVRKLEQGYDILIDDSPHVSATMRQELANGRVLLLVDKWEEALRHRNAANTAVVHDAEHAAKIIFEAHGIRAKPIEE